MIDKIESYEGHPIQVRDGFMNGTALAQANKKLIADWLPERNQRTRELCEEIELAMGIPIPRLIERGKGGWSREHTFVHPLLWPSLGQWCSRKCELWVNQLLVTHYLADFTRAAHGEPVPIPETEAGPDLEGIVIGEIGSQADAVRDDLKAAVLEAVETGLREFLGSSFDELVQDSRAQHRIEMEALSAISEAIKENPQVANQVRRTLGHMPQHPRRPPPTGCRCNLPSKPPKHRGAPMSKYTPHASYTCPDHQPADDLL
jgi:hypothetical protein